MKNKFEDDELLSKLSKAAGESKGPKLNEAIIYSAVNSDLKFAQRKFATPRLLVSLAGGAAVIASLVLSFSTAPTAKTQFGPRGVDTTFKINLGASKTEGANLSRVWVPDVDAKAGSKLSNNADGWGPLLEPMAPTSPEEYAKFLASYFGAEGELTKEKGFSTAEAELDSSSAEFDFYQIYDLEKKIEITVSPSQKGGISFNVNFLRTTTAGIETLNAQEAKNEMDTLLQDLVSSKVDPNYPAIKLTDVAVKDKFHYVWAQASQIVEGTEIQTGFSATFGDRGQLGELSGTFMQVSFKGVVPMISEVDAIKRLGSYWDNPYRVHSKEDSLIFSSKHSWLACDNNPTLGMKCETTVDTVNRGISVSYDVDGKMWLVPSYSMYHNGHFIGAVNAMSQEYLNVSR